MALLPSGLRLSVERDLAFAVALWLAAASVMVLTLPLLPVDETRYLTVAWEMRESGNWLVPTLNGQPYSHKPPLLFWLVNIAWTMFGTQIWAARIVPVGATAGVLLMTYKLGKELFKSEREGPTFTVLLLLASPAIFLYGALIMFDQLLAVWVLLGLIALWRAAQDPSSWRAWGTLGLALGLGLLTKGPVILLHLGLPALLVNFWKPPEAHVPSRKWFASLFASLAIGTAIILAWALPAAISGGPEFARMIFWKQSAGRMVDSFDHGHPFWFYGPVLVGFLLPFLFWRPLWRSLAMVRGKPLTAPVKFLLCWIGPAFVAFSLISGKQPHYLLPLLPGLALLGASALQGAQTSRGDGLLLSVPFLALFLVLAIGPGVASWAGLDTPTAYVSQGIANFSPALTLGFAVISAAVLFLAQRNLRSEALAMSVSSALLITALSLQCHFHLYKFYDLRPLAEALEPYKNGPLVFVNKYVGEIGFLARLDRPIDVVGSSAVASWFQKHPDGAAITRTRDLKDLKHYSVVYSQPFRTGWYFSIVRLDRGHGDQLPE
jgi:4-amino-4-deoxy-L-arabinose transferase-like glycosyltransferase